MSLSFYDCSVAAYLQVLGGVRTALAKAVAQSEETGLDLQSVVDFRLHEDMLPFSFQVISVWHHSLGALKGLEAGVFEPPPAMDPAHAAHMEGMAGMNHMLVQFAASPDGRWLVAGGEMSGELLVFDLTGDEPVLAHTL
ncbi:MAG: DUF1993 family protein, partial [Pseudomonadales bacterium]